MSEKPEKLACEKAIKMILEYLDNELTEHDHVSMNAHFETCRSCFSRMEFEKMLKDKISALPAKKAPDSLRDKIKKVTEKG